MAELVQQSMESMVGELEQLQRTGILTASETRALRKKREAHEYKTQKRKRDRVDYLKYIQDEIALLDLVEVRRETLGYHGKKGDIDYSIARRIKKIFKILERRFPHDERVWVSHVAFLDRMGWREEVGKVYHGMLAFHSHKARAHVRAARAEWVADGQDGRGRGRSWENARKILLNGLRILEESEELHREYFWFELSHWRHLLEEEAKKEDDDGEEDDDPVLKGALARAVFENAVSKIPTAEFACSLLKVAAGFEECDGKGDKEEGRFSLEEIKAHLTEHHSDRASTWDALANLALIKSGGADAVDVTSLKECLNVYESGASRLEDDGDSTEMAALATMRAGTALAVAAGAKSAGIRKSALREVEAAADAGVLSAGQYRSWASLVPESERVAIKNRKDFPENVSE